MTDQPDYPNRQGAHESTHNTRRASDGSHRERAEAQARETASNVKDAAWQQAESQYQQQSGFAAQQTEKLAAALRRMAEEFDQQDQRAFAGYANQLAGYSDSVSAKLRDKDLNSIMNDAQDLGRRQPALLVGGAVVTGILLSRFLRSSSANQTQTGATSAQNSSSTPRLSADTPSSDPSSSTQGSRRTF